MMLTTTHDALVVQKQPKLPFYATLWVQVLAAIVVAVVFGYFSPVQAIKMKPLGDGFILDRKSVV